MAKLMVKDLMDDLVEGNRTEEILKSIINTKEKKNDGWGSEIYTIPANGLVGTAIKSNGNMVWNTTSASAI